VLRDTRVDALTERLIESALWFAQQIGGEVQVLHAWQSYGEGPMRWGGVPPAAIARYHAVAEKDAYAELQKVVAPFRGRIARSGVDGRLGDHRNGVAPLQTR